MLQLAAPLLQIQRLWGFRVYWTSDAQQSVLHHENIKSLIRLLMGSSGLRVCKFRIGGLGVSTQPTVATPLAPFRARCPHKPHGLGEPDVQGLGFRV